MSYATISNGLKVDLKPCPFCGAEMQEIEDANERRLIAIGFSCFFCARLPSSYCDMSWESYIKTWNKRINELSLYERVRNESEESRKILEKKIDLAVEDFMKRLLSTENGRAYLEFLNLKNKNKPLNTTGE